MEIDELKQFFKSLINSDSVVDGDQAPRTVTTECFSVETSEWLKERGFELINSDGLKSVWGWSSAMDEILADGDFVAANCGQIFLTMIQLFIDVTCTGKIYDLDITTAKNVAKFALIRAYVSDNETDVTTNRIGLFAHALCMTKLNIKTFSR